MAEFEVIIEADVGDNPILPSEAALSTLDSDEAALLYTGTSVDLTVPPSKRHLPVVAAQDFINSLVNQLIENPAAYSALVGRSMERGQLPELTEEQVDAFESGAPLKLFGLIPIGHLDPIDVPDYFKAPEEPHEPSWETRVAEKMRNVAIALKEKMGTARDPQNMGERVASVIGQGTGSMLSMIVGAMAGGAIATSAAGPAAAPVGGLIGAGAASFTNEKAIMTQTLLDAGYSPQFVDQVSTWYATPVAALDMVSFGYLGALLRPMTVQAVKSTAGRSFLKFTLSRVGQGLAAITKGGLSEGTTEVIQNKIQRQYDIANTAKQPDFQKDLQEDIAYHRLYR